MNNFKHFFKAYSLSKICKIVLKYTLKCSELISSSDNKKILLTTRNVRLGFRPLCNKILLLYFGVIFLIEIRLKYEFNSAFIVFLGIQYVVPALLAYTSRKATAKAIGIGVTNHHRSWFKSTFWVILVNFWAIGCIVLVTWNHIQSAINKGQL